MKASRLIVAVSLVFMIGCQENTLAPESSETTEYASSSEVLGKKIADAQHGGTGLEAELLGSNEVAPGDPDGTGTATVTLNYGQREVCFELTVVDIDAATAAHIHMGVAGVNGGVVVPLDPPSTGFSSGCVGEVDGDLIKSIRETPSDYYVNVHNPTYPGGALRGQLSK